MPTGGRERAAPADALVVLRATRSTYSYRSMLSPILGEGAPLVVLGVISAAPSRSRRDALRSTWLRYAELSTGEVMARFAVAKPSDAQEATNMDSEAAGTDDLVLLETGPTDSTWSSLLTTFRWLQFATTTAPFKAAHYIAKMNDDAYVVVPELARQLRRLRESPHTSSTANVYTGVFHWTSYRPKSFTHAGSSDDLSTAQKASCLQDGTCQGSFPFATSSMQLLSRTLAHALVTSSSAAAHIERSKALLGQPREEPAYEDVWMGYALSFLVPSVTSITLVSLDRFEYYMDQSSAPSMKNTTMLVYLPTTGSRMHFAHNFAMRQHCSSTAIFSCSRFETNLNHLRKYTSNCSLSPDRYVCPFGPAFPILPPPVKKNKQDIYSRQRRFKALLRSRQALRNRKGARVKPRSNATRSPNAKVPPPLKVSAAEFAVLDAGQRQMVGEAATKRHADGILVPLFANAAFLPFLKNLLCSMRRLGVGNWFVIAMDNATCPGLQSGGFLTEAHACVEPYQTRPLQTADAKYGTAPFWRLVVQRPLWVRWLLMQGYSVLQCDVDVVWVRNPLPHLSSAQVQAPPKRCSHPGSIYGATNKSGSMRWKQRLGQFSCSHANSTLMLQSEQGYGYNCGFYFVRPHSSSILFMDKWMQEMLRPTHQKSMHEQHAMLYTLGNLGSMTSRWWLARGMQLVKLDEIGFPTGKVWYDNWDSPKFATDKLKAFILHCNWVTSALQKKQRLKRENLWFLDDNDLTCQARLDPLQERCQRRCLPASWCELGSACKAYSCHELTRRALTDLARSIRRPGTAREDRWHSMAWERACGSQTTSIASANGTCAGCSSARPRALDRASAMKALDRAALLLRARASATAIFADPNLTDAKGFRSFKDIRVRLGLGT